MTRARARYRAVTRGCVCLAILGWASWLRAQESVQISVPAMIAFQVIDVAAGSVGVPDPSTIAFSNAVLDPGRAVRISVKADGDLTGAGGMTIAASNASWTTSNVSGGNGVNGVLSASAYSVVFEGQAGAVAGGVDLRWSLAAPAVSRAGNYTVTLRWKVESITP